jgi:hypothetical protein
MKPVSNVNGIECRTLKGIGQRSCRKIVAQIRDAKEAVAARFLEAMDGYERLLDLALNEAEALAWQTGYPHLVFPILAVEKAQSLGSWAVRQRFLRPDSSNFRLVEE